MVHFSIKDEYNNELKIQKNSDKCEVIISQVENTNSISMYIDEEEIDLLITHLKKIKKEILKEKNDY